MKVVKFIWKRLPISWREKFWSAETDFYIARSAKTARSNSPIVVAGLFRSASGLGASARAITRALRTVGCDVIAVDLTERFTNPDIEPDINLSPMPRSRTGTLILVLNGPETSTALLSLNMFRGRAWKIVGVWAWELETFPEGWDVAFRYLDQIWAVSDFAAQAISAHRKSPVVNVVPNPIRSSKLDTSLEKSELTSPKKAFDVVIVADTRSSLERKNVLGGIEAFKNAFGNSASAHLTIKIRNLAIDQLAEANLATAVNGMENIDIKAGSMSEAEYASFMEKTDVFLSLHRSEGFGMVLAEMMSAGKVTVATNYSGNLMFMNEANSVLIDYELVAVRDPYGVYDCRQARWADPSIEQAAVQLERLFRDPALRFAIGARARKDINDNLSFESVGTKMSKFLKMNSARL